MTEKSKIVLIYSCVALIGALILSVAFYLRSQRVKPTSGDGTGVYYTRDTYLEPMFTLEKDLELVDQNGKPIKISDLKGKVWAFAQFYATCPMCAVRNDQGLKALYQKFKSDPDFRLVCITVNPEEDTVEHMKSYADALEADASSWLFLTGKAQPLKDYMFTEMKYDRITEREDPEEAAEKGKLQHNMRISVFNRDLTMVGYRDLYQARLQGEKVYLETEKALHQMVDAVLNQK